MAQSVERERAERGEVVLDALYGPDWHWDEEFDNLKTLDIRSGEQCIGGKLERKSAVPGLPGYFVMIDRMRERGLVPLSGGALQHGFVGDLRSGSKGKQTQAWCELITERRSRALSDLETGLEGVRTDGSQEAALAGSQVA